MATDRHRSFSRAFERSCHLAAIAGTVDLDELVQKLIMQALAIFTQETLQTPEDLTDAIWTAFDVDLPASRIAQGLDMLLSSGRVRQDHGYRLTEAEIAGILDQIAAADKLETRMRDEWFQELDGTHPSLDKDALWTALRTYLALAFRRHGIQAAALLNPFIETSEDDHKSLTELLTKSVTANLSPEDHASAIDAVSTFLSGLSASASRIRYIAQLADATFNFFALTSDPDAAAHLRKGLEPLMLFLDTNFLFGILGLSAGPLVDVSLELHRMSQDAQLPISVYYHPVTAKEMRAVVDYSERQLRAHKWQPSLSRALVNSCRCLSGIEFAYHQVNANTPISPAAFLSPYRHADVLLSEKGINEYCIATSDDQQHRIRSEYISYLSSKNRSKRDNALEHDAALLAVVMELRSNAPSSLSAGALLVTCDYNLHRFEWGLSKTLQARPCTVLPNALVQVLRYLLPRGAELDKHFAETFALAEFRTITSDTAQACSRLAGLLASYENMDESVATRILANDMLISQLEDANSDEEFAGLVESSLLAENAYLMHKVSELEASRKSDRLRADTAERRAAQLETMPEDRRSVFEEDVLVTREERGDAIGVADAGDGHAASEVDDPGRTKGTRASMYRALFMVSFGVLCGVLVQFLVIPWASEQSDFWHPLAWSVIWWLYVGAGVVAAWTREWRHAYYMLFPTFIAIVVTIAQLT